MWILKKGRERNSPIGYSHRGGAGIIERTSRAEDLDCFCRRRLLCRQSLQFGKNPESQATSRVRGISSQGSVGKVCKKQRELGSSMQKKSKKNRQISVLHCSGTKNAQLTRHITLLLAAVPTEKKGFFFKRGSSVPLFVLVLTHRFN
jgi:hypothetical protein